VFVPKHVRYTTSHNNDDPWRLEILPFVINQRYMQINGYFRCCLLYIRSVLHLLSISYYDSLMFFIKLSYEFLNRYIKCNAITSVTRISHSRNHITTFIFRETYLIGKHTREQSRNCLIYVFLIR